MPDELVQRLRSFNRFYTQRLGLLTDRYLGQDRPLAEARVLFEIGTDGIPIRDLRRRLELDSGYLTRLIRSLQRAGLVLTATSPGDRRLRLVRPTGQGHLELTEMDHRANAATSDLVERLDPTERQQLGDAVRTMERLLRTSVSRDHDAVPLRVASRADAAAIASLLRRVFDEQRDDFTGDALAASTPGADTIAHRITRDRVWVVEWNGHLVGTVTAKLRQPVCWVRSLAVEPEARGLGIADRLLDVVEAHAVDQHVADLELDTTPFQSAAARLYRRRGFRPVRHHEVLGTEMIRMRKPLPTRP